MPGKGFRNIGIRDDLYKELKQEKKKGVSFSNFVEQLLFIFRETKEKYGKSNKEENSKDMVTKEDLSKAIKGLENDIGILVRDVVKDAFNEMKGY